MTSFFVAGKQFKVEPPHITEHHITAIIFIISLGSIQVPQCCQSSVFAVVPQAFSFLTFASKACLECLS